MTSWFAAPFFFSLCVLPPAAPGGLWRPLPVTAPSPARDLWPSASRHFRGLNPSDPQPRIGARDLCVQGPLQLVSMLPQHFDLQHSLPLQLCDLAGMVTIYALWTGHAGSRERGSTLGRFH